MYMTQPKSPPPPPRKITPTNNIMYMYKRQINTTANDTGIYYIIIDIKLTDDAAIECQK